jgi:hypothetical protein
LIGGYFGGYAPDIRGYSRGLRGIAAPQSVEIDEVEHVRSRHFSTTV